MHVRVMRVRERRHGGPGAGHPLAERRLHLAIVSASDGIVATIVGRSAEGLLIRLSRYVKEYAPTKLWPQDARRVAALLDSGQEEAAIELYFARVGDRWDAERLHREVCEVD